MDEILQMTPLRQANREPLGRGRLARKPVAGIDGIIAWKDPYSLCAVRQVSCSMIGMRDDAQPRIVVFRTGMNQGRVLALRKSLDTRLTMLKNCRTTVEGSPRRDARLNSALGCVAPVRRR